MIDRNSNVQQLQPLLSIHQTLPIPSANLCALCSAFSKETEQLVATFGSLVADETLSMLKRRRFRPTISSRFVTRDSRSTSCTTSFNERTTGIQTSVSPTANKRLTTSQSRQACSEAGNDDFNHIWFGVVEVNSALQVSGRHGGCFITVGIPQLRYFTDIEIPVFECLDESSILGKQFITTSLVARTAFAAKRRRYMDTSVTTFCDALLHKP